MPSRCSGDTIRQEKKAYRAELPAANPGWPVDVRLLAGCLHEHLFELGFSVGEAKRACGTYDHNICGRFAHFVGAGPQDYLLRHRLALAKQLLRHVDLAVTQIAFAVGYNSPSGFSTTFKRRVGCAPTAFREQRAPSCAL
jgi:AraC-like DNA-binding protein